MLARGMMGGGVRECVCSIYVPSVSVVAKSLKMFFASHSKWHGSDT
jgi:hypothetical protein